MMGSTSSPDQVWQQYPYLISYQRALLADTKELDLSVVPMSMGLKEAEEELQQYVADLLAKKRFIEREEQDINLPYNDLLCHILGYFKDILGKEENVRFFIMTLTME
jgi:uncharacterized protein YbgA (DUF1722 family)